MRTFQFAIDQTRQIFALLLFGTKLQNRFLDGPHLTVQCQRQTVVGAAESDCFHHPYRVGNTMALAAIFCWYVKTQHAFTCTGLPVFIQKNLLAVAANQVASQLLLSKTNHIIAKRLLILVVTECHRVLGDG